MEARAERRKCGECGQNFELVSEDFAFYEKLEVPPPRLCPECRQIRRMLQVNQLHLFRRTCDGTGKQIISAYPPDSRFKVYTQEFWYTDAVDNCEQGREFDFSRGFFEQFAELQRAVPRPALFTDFARDENSAYTNFAGRNKSCYLIFDSDENRDCLYSYSINGSTSSLDCYRAEGVELCCRLVDCRNCYGSAYLSNCENCRDSYFLENCIGCKSCLMCCNLRQKEFYVMNEPVTKEQFEALRAGLKSHQTVSGLRESWEKFRLGFPQKFLRGYQNENVEGNYLTNCKNAWNCFDCRDLWDGRYCFQSFMELKDCMDTDQCGEGELLYECNNLGYNAYSVRFSQLCLNQVRNLTYCELCFNGCSDLFGCVGLKKKKYCILNRQYTKDEYDVLVPRIIRRMKETGEWGESFPASCAATPYNLSVAQFFRPLDKASALRAGYAWRDEDSRDRLPATSELPDSIAAAEDSVLGATLACESCNRNYKIIAQELAFYRERGLPLPRSCFLCRHGERLAQRTPRRLWDRSCAKCAVPFRTAFSPERPETVYCEACFQNEAD